jgi:hypothetical protein
MCCVYQLFIGYGGKVIIGSWYGTHTAPLQLGLAFHRSHLHLKASQVSTIPAQISDRWSKQRRFTATWHLVKQLKPSGNVFLRLAHVHLLSSLHTFTVCGHSHPD